MMTTGFTQSASLTHWRKEAATPPTTYMAQRPSTTLSRSKSNRKCGGMRQEQWGLWREGAGGGALFDTITKKRRLPKNSVGSPFYSSIYPYITYTHTRSLDQILAYCRATNHEGCPNIDARTKEGRKGDGQKKTVVLPLLTQLAPRMFSQETKKRGGWGRGGERNEMSWGETRSGESSKSVLPWSPVRPSVHPVPVSVLSCHLDGRTGSISFRIRRWGDTCSSRGGSL